MAAFWSGHGAVVNARATERRAEARLDQGHGASYTTLQDSAVMPASPHPRAIASGPPYAAATAPIRDEERSMSSSVPPPNDDPREAKARAKGEKAYRKAQRPWYKKKRF